MTLLEMYRRERALIRAKIERAGYDPDAIIWRARVTNWWQEVRQVMRDYRLYRAAGLVPTMRPQDAYRTYDHEATTVN